MTKPEWDKWYARYRKRLSEWDLFELDQSEELQRALDARDYRTAEEVVFDIIENSN